MKPTASALLTGAGIIGTTCAMGLSLIGLLGIVASSGHLCPASVSAARCRDAADRSAGLAINGFLAAGVASVMFVAGKNVDPEA